MRAYLRIACLVIAAVLIGYGIFLPIEQDQRWLLCLWVAAPLLLLAAYLSFPESPRGVTRSVFNLGVVIALGFSMLTMQLLRQQFVKSETLYNYVYFDEQSGQNISNARVVRDAARVQRGSILDRNGVALAASQPVEGGAVQRVYPAAAQYNPASYGSIVGYFSGRYGQSGIEAMYSDYLNGSRDPIGVARDSLLGQNRAGDNVQLTIDVRLQNAAAAALAGRPGSVVILNPKTGEVLAMVSSPGFDPQQLTDDVATGANGAAVEAYWNSLNSDASGQPLLNRPTQGRYPPGSTYKTVTAIGALEYPDQGQPDEITCPNTLQTAEGAPPVVNAVENLARFTGDPSNLERVYAYSCNTAFAQYSLRLGPERMADLAERFDIYRPGDASSTYGEFSNLLTESSLLYTQSGYLENRAGLADTGYGQGQLFVTPLQMAMVAAAVANDGIMMQPYLVSRITRPDGTLVTGQSAREIRRTMSSDTSATMRKNMRAGVEYGFGKAAQQVDPAVALVGGKSGTAEHGEGLPTHAWFIAIAPVNDPRYAVAVMLENGGEGSGAGAQLAGAVIKAAFDLE